MDEFQNFFKVLVEMLQFYTPKNIISNIIFFFYRHGCWYLYIRKEVDPQFYFPRNLLKVKFKPCWHSYIFTRVHPIQGIRATQTRLSLIDRSNMTIRDDKMKWRLWWWWCHIMIDPYLKRLSLKCSRRQPRGGGVL